MATAPRHIDLLAPPQAPMALADIPGGQPGLLPIAVLAMPLRIDVPPWPISMPTPATPETLSLFWNGSFIAEKVFDAPIVARDCFIEVPPDHLLKEGEIEVTYQVRIYNGSVGDSTALTLTIDRTAPVLGGDRGRLSFAELGAQDVTDDFLNAHGNRLQGQVPAYQQVRAGDTIIHYWDDEPLDDTQVGEHILSERDAGLPVTIDYDGDMIRQRGDGTRYAQYRIRDRAGNESQTAVPKALTIDAQPVPRVLPWVEVPLAMGGGDTLILELIELDAPLQIHIPSEAVIGLEESFKVNWGAGLFGALDVPGEPGIRRYSVAERNVATMSGKTVAVRYLVDAREGLLQSAVRWVKVNPLSRSRLPIPQLSGAMGTTLRLGQQVQDPAITLAAWKLISTDQRIRIDVHGVSANGAQSFSVMRDHAVSQEELTLGIGSRRDALVPLSFLRGLVVGQNFIVEVKASFDAGRTWPALPNFQPLEITLLA
ncbi:hypothetical protein ACQKO6_02635 [Pseudomonas monteilii]|uniref:hypothetical protein n=1 Tax=Pseudomonas alabamensis TaxID=3064349 RepID=UPI0027137C70|nr:hypothetical protein [Pseudomonas sp. 22-AL-CL-001]MDO7912672.1 hypothetical protein [Pseudomonas sp. 22-AL-CL-001]